MGSRRLPAPPMPRTKPHAGRRTWRVPHKHFGAPCTAASRPKAPHVAAKRAQMTEIAAAPAEAAIKSGISGRGLLCSRAQLENNFMGAGYTATDIRKQ